MVLLIIEINDWLDIDFTKELNEQRYQSVEFSLNDSNNFDIFLGCIVNKSKNISFQKK
jgi:hypothetical protein